MSKHPATSFLRNCLRKMVRNNMMPIAIDMPPGRYIDRAGTDEWTTAELRLFNDKQLVDLMWLYRTHKEQFYSDSSAGFRKLFKARKFDDVYANELVEKKGSISAKLDYIGIAHRSDIQLELCCLRSTPVRLHQANTRKRESISALLHQHTADPDEDAIDHHYAVYKALRLSQGSPAGAMRMYRMLCGADISRDRVARRKKKFDKWFALQPGTKAANNWIIS